MIALTISVIIFISLTTLSEFILHQEIQRQDEIRQKELTNRAGDLRALIETELNSSLYLTSGLISYLQASNGKVNASVIDSWLEGLVLQGQYIRNIGIAPGNKITYIYPLKGNEEALGLYYPDIPAQWKAVKETIQLRKPVLAGPIKLKQGGTGFIYRLPVFLNNSKQPGTETYWGMVSTVMHGDKFLDYVSQQASKQELSITIARLDNSGRFLDMIYGKQADHQTSQLKLNLGIPGANWQIAADLNKPVSTSSVYNWLQLGSWLLPVAVAILVYLLFRFYFQRINTSRKLVESQLQFSRVFDNAPQGMALIDLQGKLFEVNAALCTLTGYSTEQLKTMHLTSLSDTNYQAENQKQYDELLTLQNHGLTRKVIIQDVHGESIECLLNVAAVETSTPYYIAQVQDIREYKRLEQLKSGFISAVNHELRTPLTSISGSLSLLTAGTVGQIPGEAQDMLVIAYKNAQRLNSLINDLLDMDKLVAGKMTFTPGKLAVRTLLEDAVAFNKPYADKYHVTLKLELDTNAYINVDERRIQQVLSNLISNAAKFSPAGSTVSLHARETEGSIRVSITDLGSGIPEEFKSRIFEKFSQADDSNTKQQGGTGLGLAISKEMVNQMGGEIGFTSEAENGSTFWFEFPAARP